VIPTLVIGLREGLEASLIVGIVASFLARSGRRDALRSMWIGVGAAVLLCAGIGIALVTLSADLPQRAQEGMETVIGALAVVMVTMMIIWMSRRARSMKRDLEHAAAHALARGSATALVAMAFLAVLREGFETSVFLVSVLQGSASTGSAAAGAFLGVAIAVAVGYGIFRSGVRVNLARFFNLTGLVLVLVPAVRRGSSQMCRQVCPPRPAPTSPTPWREQPQWPCAQKPSTPSSAWTPTPTRIPRV
jgi:high-affinity iron transporter